MQFGTVALSIAAITVLAIPGFILTKTKLLNTNSIPPLTALLLYVTSPLLTFNSFQESDYSPELLTNLLWMCLVCLIVYAVMSALAILIGKPKKASLERRVSSFMSMFPNGGFMGIPLLQSLFPNNPEPILYAAVAIAFFNLFVWTVGGYLLTGERKYISVKNAFLNPATIALLISIPLFIFGIKISDFAMPLHNALKMFGNCTTPLAMTILGIRLANVPIKNIFADYRVYIVDAAKLLAMPLITFAILLLFPNIDVTLKAVAFIVSAMPSATMGVVFSEKYFGDGSYATACFVNSTLLSMITVPLMILLFL
ncbi:MAG TPA: AEC family transporter [Clostridia bacterium]|nr:AEC family transporter [Clostridia bacterium]